MVFETLLDPVFSPLLGLPALVSVTLLSLFISLVTIIIYKYTTNQKLLKTIKEDMKTSQKKLKELRENPKEMMKVQKKMMESNMTYMKESFKATLFTFLPIIIIFSWMNANFAFDPIQPGENFDVTLTFNKGFGNVTLTPPEGIQALDGTTKTVQNDKATFLLKGVAGEYMEGKSLKFEYDNKIFFKDVIITDGPKYAAKDTPIKDSNLKLISLGYQKKIVLPGLNWGWLGTYILLSIGFSMLLRKLMKVY